MKPKDLLFAHRYTEAVEAYRAHLLQHPEQDYYPGLGRALLCLGLFPEALSAFKKANEIGSQRIKGSVPCINEIATALWLSGGKNNAKQQWQNATQGILNGSIHYGDAAGGVTQGLLLWYAAVTLNDADTREYALKYMRSLISKKVYGSAVLWPRPIAMMVLGDCSFEKVLEIGVGSCVLDDCIKEAKNDLLKRRRLCQTLFYSACRERESGIETKCIKMMLTCCNLENPIIELEWYLARKECCAREVVD